MTSSFRGPAFSLNPLFDGALLLPSPPSYLLEYLENQLASSPRPEALLRVWAAQPGFTHFADRLAHLTTVPTSKAIDPRESDSWRLVTHLLRCGKARGRLEETVTGLRLIEANPEFRAARLLCERHAEAGSTSDNRPLLEAQRDFHRLFCLLISRDTLLRALVEDRPWHDRLGHSDD